MARDISIAISAKDNFSQSIATMRNANQSFNKDLTGLQTKLNELNRTKAILKVDTDKAKSSLKDAEKQFAKTGEAADKLNLELSNANYENARRNLSLVSGNAKQAEKDILNLTGAISKSENRAGRSGSSGGTSGLLSGIATSGAVGMVGNILSDLATTGVGSAYGGEASILASSALSSGAMGAAIGTAIAPGIGTAVGALSGALLGYIQGQNKIFEAKDEAFKSYYEELYSTVLDSQNQSLALGSGVASTREANRISFSTLLGGDKQANEYLNSLTDFASVTPFAYDELTNISKVLLAYGYKQEELLPLLEKVGDAGSALGMSSEDMKYVATSLGRMQTTDKTTLEYLNPLLERGIDVWGYLAEASGKTKKEVQEMVHDGLVPGGEAAKAIADYMGVDFAGNMEKQAQTYAGLVSTLGDAQTELDNAMGAGYNSTRKGGMQDQIDWLSGENGEEMQDAYNKIGQWKASLENQKEQYQRDAIGSVMDGSLAESYNDSSQKEALEKLITEYKVAQADYYDASKLGNEQGLQEAGAEMGRIIAEAQAIATNEYNASDGAQLLRESNKTLAENIKDDTATQENYWDAGYSMGQQFTLGLASALSESEYGKSDELDSIVDTTGRSLTPEQILLAEDNKGRLRAGNATGHAYGLNYVPYNNYPAMLHEGERVLTASENRSYGGGVQVSITGNNITVRSDDDIRKIGEEAARQVAQQMKQAYDLST
jgi:tape measure domain-containing protein